MEEKIDDINSTLEVMKGFFMKGGFLAPKTGENKSPSKAKDKERPQKKRGKSVTLSDEVSSEITIYDNALKKISYDQQVDLEISFKGVENMEIDVQMNELEDKNTNQNFSSSSDEPIDTSDELLDVDANAEVEFNERFIADCAAEAQ